MTHGRLRGLWIVATVTLLAVTLAPSALAAPLSVGSGSCSGTDACTGATGNIGDNSCKGLEACINAHADIGNNSCSEIANPSSYKPCKDSLGAIGNSSCSGNGACLDTNATIGDNSCDTGSACQGFVGQIGNGSCNEFASCISMSGTVGNNACNGIKACQMSGTLNIADNTCNGDYACLGVLDIVFVTPTGAGAKDGTSWANAFDGLANALPFVSAGDEIWVAAGTYLPTRTGDVPDRSDTFGLRAGTWIYGGFAGTETARDQRDWMANPTVLSGDIGVASDASDNAYHVVMDADHATLDGFTITGGKNNHLLTFSPDDYGGGILTLDNSTFRNLLVTGNYSINGGGIGVTGSQPVFSNIFVTNNRATVNGGGIALISGVPTPLNNVIVSGNSAVYGGGVFTDTGNPTLKNVTIASNLAVLGGGVYVLGGGPAIDNSILWGNATHQIDVAGGGATVSHSIIEGGLPGGTVDGGGNLSSDPGFVAPVSWAIAPTATGDYHLQSTSPAMNAGLNSLLAAGQTTDIELDARILSGTVDMGADEVRTTCVPGYYSASGDDRTGSCTPAAIGYYVDHSGATGQTACPSDMTTAATASDSSSDCVPVQHTLSVTKAGTGTGTVSGAGGAINCGATCTAQIAHNAPVALVASESAGSRFTGWGGDCSGGGTCNLTMTGNHAVTAKFSLLCTPGHYSATGDDRASSCFAADIGFYVDHSGATSQTGCPAGTTTAGSASTSSAQCVSTYVSARARKQAAAAELELLLPSGNARVNQLLTEAIQRINASLAPRRWNGQDALNAQHGARVFRREEHALTWLWRGPILSRPNVSAVANDAINQLVAADRQLVVHAIAASSDAAAIATATAKLAQADALIAAHLRGPAISKLRAAWAAVT